MLQQLLQYSTISPYIVAALRARPSSSNLEFAICQLEASPCTVDCHA